MSEYMADMLDWRLSCGLERMGLELTSEQRGRLLAYLGLLAKWNRTYNLTAVRDPLDMVTLHLLDSLSVLPYIQGERLLDLGTGAGLPGLALAIIRPELRCVLLDSNAKKTRFCIQAAGELGLANVEVVHSRIENYRPKGRFDTLITRAFSSVRGVLEGCRGLGGKDGVLLLMKGTFPASELDEVAEIRECVKVIPVSVPGLEAERHLVIVELGSVGRLEGG